MAGKAPEKQDPVLFDLFGRKKEEKKEKMHVGQMMQAPAFHPHNQAQTAPYHHPAAAFQNGAATHNQAAEHDQVRPPGYEGQYFTAGETEKQLHRGIPGKFHSTDNPDSSSSSEEEEEDGQRKTGGSKKKRGNDKLPGGHHSS
uniref:Dehydrin n=1 Tax=Pinus pinaster TaxID=71647 RepID=A0A088MRE0_PINPS|nr:dehydrin [Pinus pinaster]